MTIHEHFIPLAVPLAARGVVCCFLGVDREGEIHMSAVTSKVGPPDIAKYLARHGFQATINADFVVVQDPVYHSVPQSIFLRLHSMEPVTIRNFDEAIRFVEKRS